ncbi:MAG: hypothetical protein ABIB43_02510 [archaeon]
MKLKITPELAYLSGVLMGDGSINVRKEKHDYEVSCVGNPKDEKEFYQNIVSPLIYKLFNKKVEPKHHHKNTTYGVRFWSKEIVEFLTQKLEHPIGKKYNKIKIPTKIKRAKLVSQFIRGVADTDFCISFKKRNKKIPYYPVISGVSKNKLFIEEIAIFLERKGIALCRTYNYKQFDKRFKKGFAITNRIDIYGFSNLKKWMEEIGFSNQKHLNKIQKYGRKK